MEIAPDGDAIVTDIDAFVVPDCTVCGGRLKPDVVFFGEFVPAEKYREASALVRSSDALLIAGSSLVVNSGIRLLEEARRRRLPDRHRQPRRDQGRHAARPLSWTPGPRRRWSNWPRRTRLSLRASCDERTRVTRISLVRHGQTDWNLAKRIQGSSDIPLNATGRAQAEATGRALAGGSYDAIYASPLAGRCETASIIAAHIGLDDPDCRCAAVAERRYGEAEGLTGAEILARWPEGHAGPRSRVARRGRRARAARAARARRAAPGRVDHRRQPRRRHRVAGAPRHRPRAAGPGRGHPERLGARRSSTTTARSRSTASTSAPRTATCSPPPSSEPTGRRVATRRARRSGAGCCARATAAVSTVSRCSADAVPGEPARPRARDGGRPRRPTRRAPRAAGCAPRARRRRSASKYSAASPPISRKIGMSLTTHRRPERHRLHQRDAEALVERRRHQRRRRARASRRTPRRSRRCGTRAAPPARARSAVRRSRIARPGSSGAARSRAAAPTARTSVSTFLYGMNEPM